MLTQQVPQPVQAHRALPGMRVARCPFTGSHGAVWGSASCWQHGLPTQAALSCFAFCSVLGETRVSPVGAVPHRHNHMGCVTQLPGEGLLLRSPSPHADCPCIWGALRASLMRAALRRQKYDAFPAQTVGLKQIKRNSFKLSGEPRCTRCRG